MLKFLRVNCLNVYNLLSKVLPTPPPKKVCVCLWDMREGEEEGQGEEEGGRGKAPESR